MKPWVLTTEAPEGKYLVVRRDGSIPERPHFVLGGNDPATPTALRAYADHHEALGTESEYVEGVRELADLFDHRQQADWSMKCDPESGPHRTDDPDVVEAMIRKGNIRDHLTG